MRTHENLIRASEWPLISPHKDAPLYACPHEAQQELLRQAITEITSESGFNVGNPDVRELLRQTALVNMFFYLRFVLGFSGPYTLLTPDLHLDMCNFYQLTREKGTWAFGCLFRKGYKSQTWTCGGTSWDILRDPNWEEVLASNVIERSIEFNSYIQDGFENNELMAVLFPEFVPPAEGRTEAWNSKMTRVPCKRGKKPNVRVVAVGGSIQGLHGNSFKVDDLIGEHMLDANRRLGADNEKARNWLISAIRNIPNSKATSNIFVLGTRYGPDDAYSEVWKSMKKFYGYTLGEPWTEKPGGEWTVYYRSISEDYGDGKATSILPQVMTDDELETIQREDPWTYWTQQINMSTYSGLSELIDYHTRECTLDTDVDGQLVVTYVDHLNGKHVDTPLAHLDVIAACDPAASSERKSIRTSKSAYGVVARSHDNQILRTALTERVRAGHDDLRLVVRRVQEVPALHPFVGGGDAGAVQGAAPVDTRGAAAA
jgi:hypothetical protein